MMSDTMTERPTQIYLFEMVDLGEEGTLWAVPSAHVSRYEAAASLRRHLFEQGVTGDYEPFWDEDVIVSHIRGDFVEREGDEAEWVPDENGEDWTFVSLRNL